MRILSTTVCMTLLLTGCGENSSNSSLKEEWDQKNLPNLISGPDFKAKLSELPKSGSLDVIPWSDDYWATARGGIAYRWQTEDYGFQLMDKETAAEADTSLLSPAEKYDLFVGREDFPLTRAERSRTKIMMTVEGSDTFDPDKEIPMWEGLCHGWAPASFNFEEPGAVSLKGAGGRTIDFTSGDVKALITYYHQYSGNRSTRTSFMSNRCEESYKDLQAAVESGELTQKEMNDKMETAACSDTNAGSFHIVLANEIGIRKKSFIIDKVRDAEVWNHPVSRYSSTIQAKEGVDENAAPDTVKEVLVRTKLTYVVEINPQPQRVTPPEVTDDYEYILELDNEGKIVGGRWLSYKRPDFLWRETKPDFRGYFKALELIYEESIK